MRDKADSEVPLIATSHVKGALVILRPHINAVVAWIRYADGTIYAVISGDV